MRPLTLFLYAGGILALTLKAAERTTPSRDDVAIPRAPAQQLDRWNDWRLGLFIHWGAWSQTEIGYIWKIVEDSPGVRERRFELNQTFNPVNFAPEKWAKAAKEAGMKYVVFVTKHHDGFNNFDTALSDLKITAPSSPFHNDPRADLTKAVIAAFRAEGLGIGLYYSHIDWHHADGRYFSHRHWDYDRTWIDRDPERWRRFAEFEKGQIRELLTNYGKIDILWFDIYWPFAEVGPFKVKHPRVRSDVLDLVRMIRELQPDILINDRGTDIYGDFATPEARMPAAGAPGSWETSFPITEGRGYWYKGENATAFSVDRIVRMLIESASKGGNILFNVGPRGDGELMALEYDRLAGLGRWMTANGESIYGTTRSLFPELPWGWSTTRGSTLYLHVLEWPSDGKLRLPGLKSEVKRAYLLCERDRQLAVTKLGKADRVVDVGSTRPDPIATVIAVEVAGTPNVETIIRQREDGSVVLDPWRSVITGQAYYAEGAAGRSANYIAGLTKTTDEIAWEFRLSQGGAFVVEIEIAVETGEEGSAYEVLLDGRVVLSAEATATADWEGLPRDVSKKDYIADGVSRNDNRWMFKRMRLGRFTVDAGDHTLVMRGTIISRNYLFYLGSTKLVPVP